MITTQEMVDNIKAYYLMSTRLEKQQGKVWYRTANRICTELAELYDVPITTVIGIMSALSPRNKWERNVRDTEAVLVHGENATVATFNANKVKAVRILNGEEPLDVLSGNKVRSFYECIKGVEWGCCIETCIDSHAYGVACGYGERIKPKSISDRLYLVIQSAYVQAAADLDLQPMQLQAITWLAYKRIHNI